MLPEVLISQHIPHIHENLVSDYNTFNPAYKNAYRKLIDPGSMEDWAVAQKYKVQLTDARLIFDQAYDEEILSKAGIKEYLELLLYQNEFLLYHQILESDLVDRFTEDEMMHYLELSSAWRMIKEQKSFRYKNWRHCVLFDSQPFFDPSNPNVEYTWIIEGQHLKATSYEHCFKNAGAYPITLRTKNLLTGYYLPDSTFNYTIDQPMTAEFSELDNSAEIGEWMEFEIAESMKSMCEAVWVIGDGSIKVGNKIRHRFTSPGTYTITQHLSYSEHNLDHVKSKSYQIFVKRPEVKKTKWFSN